MIVQRFTSISPIGIQTPRSTEQVGLPVHHGGFRTSAQAALEKEATLLPAQVRIERDALNTVAYYLSHPPSHVIRSLLRQAITSPPKNPKNCSVLHFVKRLLGVRWPSSVPARGQRIRGRGVKHTATAAEKPGAPFDDFLGMERIVPVYAAPWNEPLPFTTIILGKDDALGALDTALRDEQVWRATWFTDGSLLEGRAGGAAVRVEDGQERERLVVPLGDGQVFDGEMEGLVQAMAKARWAHQHSMCRGLASHLTGNHSHNATLGTVQSHSIRCGRSERPAPLPPPRHPKFVDTGTYWDDW
ncbi:hypothetical protein DFH06DRAFT_1142876 [Mycena polygramma]|nr:hypothetical protein DFH06DRAFT_1142876 [Mycena polygramma]